MPGLPQNHVSHASKQPGARPSTYHRFGRFHRARAYEEQREASPARLVKEHGTPCCFHARAINSPHRLTPPLFLHSLSSHSLSLLNLFPQTSGCFLSQCWGVDQRRRLCTIITSPPPLPLLVHHRIVLCDEGALQPPDLNLRRLYNVGEASKTLNPHLLSYIYPYIDCRHTVDGMYGRFARVRVNQITVWGLFPFRILLLYFVVLCVHGDFI
jgi:hypothetical protein